MNIFFDLDGTLIDVSNRHWSVYGLIVRKMGGKPLPKSEYWQKKRACTSWPAMLSRSGITEERVGDFLKDFIDEIEKPEHLRLDQVLPGVFSVLGQLHQEGHVLYLASLRRHEERLDEELNRLNIKDYFTEILSGHTDNEGYTKKVTLIKPYLGREDALIIGDTEADIRAGKELRITTIAVLSGVRNEKHLSAEKPDYLIPSVQYLISAIETTRSAHKGDRTQ